MLLHEPTPRLQYSPLNFQETNYLNEVQQNSRRLQNLTNEALLATGAPWLYTVAFPATMHNNNQLTMADGG